MSANSFNHKPGPKIAGSQNLEMVVKKAINDFGWSIIIYFKIYSIHRIIHYSTQKHMKLEICNTSLKYNSSLNKSLFKANCLWYVGELGSWAKYPC